jgi:phage terminase small subunit
MSRPRTPTAILDARGSFKKDPQRKRDGEPVVKNPLGDPPECLDEMESKIWREVAGMAPLGVLTEADRFLVEDLAMLTHELRVERGEFQVGKRALRNKMMGQIGMTPSDRAKLSIEKPKKGNTFADLDI